jgi:hypothetical protein
MAAVEELNGDRKLPLLMEMSGAATPTPEARERLGRQCIVSRIALLGESADRVHASFGPLGLRPRAGRRSSGPPACTPSGRGTPPLAAQREEYRCTRRRMP